jgi:hypothetical protein
MNPKGSRPITTRDLLPSERTFLDAMHRLGHGRYESLKIHNGELVLDPWPTAIRNVKFGTHYPDCEKKLSAEFNLKRQVAELFEYIRSVGGGSEICVLEIFCGLPFSMRIEHRAEDQAEVRRG